MPIKRKRLSRSTDFEPVPDATARSRRSRSDRPQKALTKGKPKTGGRNNTGQLTSRFIGGGHKQKYRDIDFKRDKHGDPGEGRGDRVRPEPHRAHRAAALRRRREALHPLARTVWRSARQVDGGRGRRHPRGQRPAAVDDPPRHGDPQHRAQGRQGRPDGPHRRRRRAAHGPRGRLGARSSSPRARCARCTSSATPRSARSATSSTRTCRSARPAAPASSGKKPHNRGVSMNPVDHPLGGGEGKTSGGRHPDARGASRPRATRPGTTSGRTSSSSAVETRSKNRGTWRVH